MAPIANNNNSQPSLPIPIRTRTRAESDSESESSASPTTPYSTPAPFPTTATGYPPRITPVSPSTSPILSFFLSQTQAPSKSPTNTYPFRRGFAAPVIEDDEASDAQDNVPRHDRRASTTWAGNERVAQVPVVSANAEHHGRAAGIMRRLSLGGALGRPQLPMLKPTGGVPERSGTPPGVFAANRNGTQTAGAAPGAGTPRKARRSNTLGARRPRWASGS